MTEQLPAIFKLFSQSYLGRILSFVVVFVGAGLLGLALAPESGVNTIIWPPAGIALGILLMCGLRLWPGVFIGGFILSALHGADIQTLFGFGVASYAGLAATLQAVVGYGLITRFAGRPIRLKSLPHILWLLFLAGPISGAVLPILHEAFTYFVPAVAGLTNNPVGVWISQVVGIWVFMTLVLLMPCGHVTPLWKGKPLKTFTALAFVVLMVPLGATFYGWKLSIDNEFSQANAQFEEMVHESKRAFKSRLLAYEQSVQAAAAFVENSEHINANQWQDFITQLGVEKRYKGIQGIGYIQRFNADEVQDLAAELSTDWGENITLNLASQVPEHFIITHIAPLHYNRGVLGYDLQNSPARLQTAQRAGKTRTITLSEPLKLIQNVVYRQGFTLYYPVYTSVADNSGAAKNKLSGWVYAPLIIHDLFAGLTSTQNEAIDLTVSHHFEGGAQQEIYATLLPHEIKRLGSQQRRMKKTEVLNVYGQTFTLTWYPNDSYMANYRSFIPAFIVVGGLTFTLLLAMFMMVLIVRDADTMNELSGERKMFIPLLIFILGAGATFALYQTLKKNERAYVENLTQDKAQRLESFIQVRVKDKLMALERMSRRWEVSKRTPAPMWRHDVRQHIKDQDGLRAIEWVDETYTIQLVEPIAGNEDVIGLDVRYDELRRKLLQSAKLERVPTISPPVSLIQGYMAIVAYFPLYIDEKFDGFMVGLFDVEEFLSDILSQEKSSNYAIEMLYAGHRFYQNSERALDHAAGAYTTVRDVIVFDKVWQLHVTPTQTLVRSQRTALPYVVLILGFVVAGLISLTLRYALLSRVRSYQQKESEERFKSAMNNASIGMALVSREGKWLAVNKALCQLLGYTEEEFKKLDFQTITHADDLDKDLTYVKQMMTGEIDSYQMEKRYIHKKGYVIWTLLSVSSVYDANGELKHFISQVQDITDRKQVDEMKSNFISTVSHELRTPLTSIRGSLGLVLGAMADELTPKVENLLNIAHKNSERLILLINDILDLDKITAGKMRFDMGDYKLRDLIADALEVNAPYAQKHHVKLVATDVSDKLKVHVDPDRFQQIMSNLLSNAAKFSPKDEEIRIQVREKDHEVEISVIDKGPGIPAEFQSHIFEKFSQADGSVNKQTSGTGLGLHISRELTEKMGGEIGFDSQEGEGTRFWVRLPYAGKVEEMTDTEKTAGSKPVILHVDDDADFSQLLATAMVDHMHMINAQTIDQARDVLNERHVTLLLVDTYVHGENTRDLIQQVSNMKNPVPVVVLSSREPDEEIHEKAHGIMIKSRISESDIVDELVKFIKEDDDKNA